MDKKQEKSIRRIIEEGIANDGELTDYLEFVVEDAKHMEDGGRMGNNLILYHEAISIQRVLGKLLSLLAQGAEKVHEKETSIKPSDNYEGYT